MPVIITTGHRPDEIDRIVGLELGADDYIIKPFSLRGAAGPGPRRVAAVRRWEGSLALAIPSAAAIASTAGRSNAVAEGCWMPKDEQVPLEQG